MRIAGVNVLAVLLAAVAVYLIGFLIYGMLIDPAQWMASVGITQQEAEAVGAARMPYGAVMPLMSAVGTAVLFKWASVDGLMSGIKWGVMIAFAAVIPTVWYDWVYGVGNCYGPTVDTVHALVSYAVAGGILAAWK